MLKLGWDYCNIKLGPIFFYVTQMLPKATDIRVQLFNILDSSKEALG